MFRSRRLLEMKDPREPARTKEAGERQERGVQTECNPRGLSPRLSEVNLFTLLSLWMELFPNDKQKPTQQRRNGLVVVHSSKIIGLHCSSMDLHVGQIAVIKHGSRLKECDLYFSRKPCSTCLKMVLNEDQKIGVGAVIWAEGKSSNCDATGARYLIGCGYNAYPTGSEYADFPQMDEKQQKDREARKFRYIVHAEQNALTFRCQDIKEDEKTMIFVTKCPCDECIPLINSAGIKQIYTGDLDAGKVKADISYQKFSGLQGVKKFTWQKNPAHSILESGVQTVHMKSEPTKPPIFESSVASKIVNACTMRSSCEPELHCKPSVQGHSPSIEDPHSPLAKGDLKRPLIAVQPEPQIDELLNLELSEPAFKRRVVEHQCYLQSLVTSLATVMNDVVCGMEKIKSGLNTSMSDVHSVLDHHLSALQSSRESVSSQTASTQGLSCIGAALQTALSAALSDMSSKVQEGLQIGFESLGEKVQSAIRTGFADLVKEHASAHQCLCRSQGGEIPFNRGVNSPSQEEGILNSGLSLSSSHPSQLSSGSLLESSSPSMVMLAPGGRNLEKLQ
ncbi:cytidine and dCMP deaminase domain-containing protein 1 isoform X5 [Mobula birostris]|uniref:cytidine and dCMP deaminase domain-containing protein 1 isoform X5 n=1 Tax=Mobula birostris TaxID=1983395 RepID=UPI003B2831B2